MLKDSLSYLRKWLWVYCSFILPAAFFLLMMSSSLYLALRAGLTGLIAAVMIYFLWKISIRLSGFLMPEKYSDIVIGMFAVFLWAIWFAIAQVVLVAYDETVPQALHTQLRGQSFRQLELSLTHHELNRRVDKYEC